MELQVDETGHQVETVYADPGQSVDPTGWTATLLHPSHLYAGTGHRGFMPRGRGLDGGGRGPGAGRPHRPRCTPDSHPDPLRGHHAQPHHPWPDCSSRRWVDGTRDRSGMVDALTRRRNKIDERPANDKPRQTPGHHGHQRAPRRPGHDHRRRPVSWADAGCGWWPGAGSNRRPSDFQSDNSGDG